MDSDRIFNLPSRLIHTVVLTLPPQCDLPPTLQMHIRPAVPAVTTDAACRGEFEETAGLPVWTATHQLEGCHRDGGAVRLLAAVGRGDPNPMANPKKNCASSYVPSHGIGLYWKPMSSLSVPGIVVRHSLGSSTLISVVERASPKRSGWLPTRCLPCCRSSGSGSEALAGNQIANSPPDLLWHHAGPQATPGIWPKQTICC